MLEKKLFHCGRCALTRCLNQQSVGLFTKPLNEANHLSQQEQIVSVTRSEYIMKCFLIPVEFYIESVSRKVSPRKIAYNRSWTLYTCHCEVTDATLVTAEFYESVTTLEKEMPLHIQVDILEHHGSTNTMWWGIYPVHGKNRSVKYIQDHIIILPYSFFFCNGSYKCNDYR